MTHIFPRLALALAALTITGGAQALNPYVVSVDDFTELVVQDPMHVVYHSESENPKPRVAFEAEEHDAGMLIIENKKDKLTLRLNEEWLGKPDLPTVHVYSTMLFKARNNADSTLIVATNARIPKFQGRLDGNGRLIVVNVDADEVGLKKFTGNGVIEASGVTGTASLSNTGSGQIQASGLKAAISKCTLMGTGSVYTYASDQLSVKGVSGTVFYTGNPSDIQTKGVSVKLRCIDQQPAE